jgi:hypothetical protein
VLSVPGPIAIYVKNPSLTQKKITTPLKTHGTNCLNRQRRRQPSISHLNPNGWQLVYPPNLPPPILALHRQQRGQIHLVPDADELAHQHPHCKSQSVAGCPYPLTHAFPEEGDDSGYVKVRVAVAAEEQEPPEEKEEALWGGVVPRAVEVRAGAQALTHTTGSNRGRL